MYKMIVVAVDPAQRLKAERIVEKAKGLLDADGHILLVYVIEDLPSYVMADLTVDMVVDARQQADTELADLIGRSGITAGIEIRQGAPAREILAACDRCSADLVIIASHIPDLSNYLIGATADRVVRHAKCSVLIDR
ncbi:MAG: universal stress protein [Neorhizobium sp.]|nr:universal stress protein [Neorhizobium sp.]